MRAWFERDPGLLDRELTAFGALNIQVEIDEAVRAIGILRLNLLFPGPNGPVSLVATYPDFYPFFRPEVAAGGLQLARHQNPIGGNLCLIGRGTSNWFAEDTLAAIIAQQFHHLLQFGETGDLEELAAVEEPQGEPASIYYNWEASPESFVLIDSDWNLDNTIERGSFLVRAQRCLDPQLKPYVRGFVDKVKTEDGHELASWQARYPRSYRPHSRVDGFVSQRRSWAI